MSDFDFTDKEFSRFTLGRAEVVNARFREVSTAIASKVDDTGGEMTGNLKISATPTDDDHAVTRKFVTDKIPGRITISTDAPTGGQDGDIHFRVLP
jgi:hypothetical protein